MFYEIGSEEASWSSRYKYEDNNTGHRPGVKGGYFPVSPVDSLGDLRADMCKVLESLGQVVEVHHHEVANAGQCEIGVKFNTLVKKADELMTMKYVIKNVAHQAGKTVTFMPVTQRNSPLPTSPRGMTATRSKRSLRWCWYIKSESVQALAIACRSVPGCAPGPPAWKKIEPSRSAGTAARTRMTPISSKLPSGAS